MPLDHYFFLDSELITHKTTLFSYLLQNNSEIFLKKYSFSFIESHLFLQVLAAQCLTALCVSAGGAEGCTVAEQAEIDVLLNALLSPCFSVRDAALRVNY